MITTRFCTWLQHQAAADHLPPLRLQGPSWLRWRHAGKAEPGQWSDLPDLAEAIAACPPQDANADTLELCLSHSRQEIAAADLRRAFPNASRGLLGLELQIDGQRHRFAPTTSIATNRPLLKELERLARRRGESLTELTAKARFFRFESRQYLLKDGPQPSCQPLWRGGTLVRPAEIGPQMLQDTVQGMAGWLQRNVAASGRMTYKYWPSSGKTSQANNTIRQFMATVALGRLAKRSGCPDDAARARRNLRYNLATFYAAQAGIGTIMHDQKAKLGAMALAALAILEFRQSGLIEAELHQAEFDGLCRGIALLWQPDGSFRSFLYPPTRNDNQNFYPGEALLFWASLHRASKDPGLAAKCLKSFEYYRNFHLAAPNPAFVPWHSQAYVMLYQDLGITALADFVLQRNDWLLTMQQWQPALAPDFAGRFYDPDHPEYGPPHASATGVYMEGLAAAWHLAQELGQTDRAETYAQALRRGLRALRQLQFRDVQTDAFYITRPERVIGGLRTESYDNEIRVDNVQHGLMALLALEQQPHFPWSPHT